MTTLKRYCNHCEKYLSYSNFARHMSSTHPNESDDYKPNKPDITS